MFQFFAQEEDAEGEAGVLGEDGAEGDAGDVPPQAQHEEERGEDVDNVERDGDPHGGLGVLHADEPAFDGVEAEGGRSGPDADEEVGQRHLHHLAAAFEDDGHEQRYGPLQGDEHQGDGQCDGAGADEGGEGFVPALGAVGLGGEAGGAHAEEAEVPIDEVEDGGADGDGPDVGGGEVAHDGHVDHAEQGHGDVGDDVGQGQAEDALVQGSGQGLVVSGQWSVVSGQWSVVSGQWSVVRG